MRLFISGRFVSEFLFWRDNFLLVLLVTHLRYKFRDVQYVLYNRLVNIIVRCLVVLRGNFFDFFQWGPLILLVNHAHLTLYEVSQNKVVVLLFIIHPKALHLALFQASLIKISVGKV